MIAQNVDYQIIIKKNIRITAKYFVPLQRKKQ